MAGEDLGNKADDTEQQGGAEPTGAEQNPASDGSGDEGDGDVKDSHGQPGINKERHDREIAEKDAKIAELEGKLEEAAKTEEGRADLKAEIDKLRAEQAEERTAHKLEMSGCVDVKAAKARLADFDGDVAKLNEECPYLFGKDKQTGTTGKKPEGTAGDDDAELDRAFGLKKN